MEPKRLAQLIDNYGCKVGKLLSSRRKGQDYNGGTCLSTNSECEYLIRGLVFRINVYYYSRDTYLNDIHIEAEHMPYVYVYSDYRDIPLEGSWVKVVEEITEILEKVEEDDIATRQANAKQAEKDRQLQIKQTIKEWNEKYGSK
jgi:hypothetical protein